MADQGQDRVEREIEEEILLADGPEDAAGGGPVIREATQADHAAERRAGGNLLPADQVESRALLAANIERGVFPATRDDLLESARRIGAPAEVKQALAGLPDGTFEHLEAVWEALGGDVEYRA